MTVSVGIKAFYQYVKRKWQKNKHLYINYLGALNVRYVKSILYVYTALYQTLTSHFLSLASGLML